MTGAAPGPPPTPGAGSGPAADQPPAARPPATGPVAQPATGPVAQPATGPVAQPATGPVAGSGPAVAIEPGANVLGALALVLADRTADAINAAAGQAENAATALSALLHFLDRPTIETLRRVLGLTHSGAVRLVDRLAAAGYLTREPGADARGTALTLTAAGRAAAERVSRARAQVLEQALAVLDPGERATFEALAGKVLGGLVRGPGATRWICRLCDTTACGSATGRCPARTAAEARLRAAAAVARPAGAADRPV